jgi:hypothetical protein
LASNVINLTEEEKKKVEEAIRQGKLVIITRKSDVKFRIEPSDKVVVVVRE